MDFHRHRVLVGKIFLVYVKQINLKAMYDYFSDGAGSYRSGIRSGVFVVDKKLTSTGFAGTVNVDWTCILSQS